ncbi:MAG: hypothetical protein DMG23_05875 [Acidobacteria bacterium]|nr:MAG: hypothetical protein DMG23_05875 [Acidobacteriota bacterium]
MTNDNALAPIEHVPFERVGYRKPSVVTVEAEEFDSPLDLRHYWNNLVKRRWTVVTVAFVVSTVVAMVNFRMPPVYEARVSVEVEGEAPEVQSISNFYRGTPSDEAFLRTQVKVLESDSLAWQTIQQLGIDQSAEFSPPRGGKPVSPAIVQISLINAFRDHLRVEWVRNSRMLEVSFEARDPRLAAAVANALVSNYAEYNFRKRYDATRQASGWMEQQLDELKAKVEKSQQAMVDYERQNAIVNINDKQSVEEQRLAQLSNDYTNAQNVRLDKESLFELASSNEAEAAVLMQSEVLGRLEEKYAELKAQLVDASGQYGPNYPKVVRLQDQVNEIQGFIERERKRIAGRVRNDYRAAMGREKLLAAALAREKEAVGRLNQVLIQHNLLKREFETTQQLYENLLQHLKDATVSAGLRATNIHVVDPALPPAAPIRPKKTQNIAMGLLGGLALGVMLALFADVLDNSVKSVEDIERLTGMPTLAVIPLAASDRARRAWRKGAGEKAASSTTPVGLAVLKHPASPLAESYRALRTSVLLSTPGHPPQVILITSSQPNEGKSCTCLNLALTLAQRGGRVVIIDGDLRKPGVASVLGLANGKGLSSILTGAHGLEEALQQLDALPGLWVLPGGPRPPNPADLLSSVSMKEVLAELRGRFDHVVIDSPPVLLVTDATILTPLVDGIMLVVESGMTVRGAIQRTHKILENAGGKVLGVVLNKLDARRNGYYGSYYPSAYGKYYLTDEEQSAVKS